MKANELMVGDWYAFRGHPYKCTASDIASIAECEEKGAPTDISEIPLTAEILEKNGWKETWGWWSSDDCPFFMVKYADNSWAKGKYGVSFSKDKEADMFFIGSVHELQHALRLCGIEKEIEP